MPQISDILIFSLLLSMGPVQAPNAVTRETTTVATVDRIERSSRVLTAHSRAQTDGKVTHTFYVDPSVKAFDDLKVGDVVTVRFTESVVVQVRPDAKPTKLQDTTEAARKAGDANVVQQQKRTVIVEDVDSQGLFVTYRTQDNQRAVHPVQNKELLKGIRRGDRIEITLTLARAVSIEPKR
jgi:hypothetical protein